MEQIIQLAEEYLSGTISPVEFRTSVAQHLDDRDTLEKFASLLLFNAKLREAGERVVSQSEKEQRKG